MPNLRESDKLAASLKDDIKSGRYGGACDKCVALIGMNDYRGIKGLKQVRAARPDFDYARSLMEQHEPTFLKRKALYPSTFDEGEFYCSMAERFPDGVMQIAEGVHFNEHPLVILEQLAKKAKGSEEARKFLQEFGAGMGLDENSIRFFVSPI